MSKAKAQGTKRERRVRLDLEGRGLRVERLAEGGSYDEADLRAWVGEEVYDFEVRDRQAMSVHAALPKAQAKTVNPVVLVWHRFRDVGKSRRVSEGTVAVMAWQDFLDLLERAG